MAIILNNIKTLVGGSGVSLPSLANPGTKEDLMLNKELIDGNGNKVTGTMPNNGAISKTMDGLTTKSVSIPEGYTSGGTVSLTDDIDNIANTQADMIAQISAALDDKIAGSAGGGGGASVETCTVTVTGLEWDTHYEQIIFITATTFENGSYSSHVECATSLGQYLVQPITINNVVCSSVITVGFSLYSGYLAYLEIDGTIEVLYNDGIQGGGGGTRNDGVLVALKAPTVSGENAIVRFSYEP